MVDKKSNDREKHTCSGKALANQLCRPIMQYIPVPVQFSCKTKFFKGVTVHMFCPVYACIFDADVICLMKAAYPNLKLEEIALYDSIMVVFGAMLLLEKRLWKKLTTRKRRKKKRKRRSRT